MRRIHRRRSAGHGQWLGNTAIFRTRRRPTGLVLDLREETWLPTLRPVMCRWGIRARNLRYVKQHSPAAAGHFRRARSMPNDRRPGRGSYSLVVVSIANQGCFHRGQCDGFPSTRRYLHRFRRARHFPSKRRSRRPDPPRPRATSRSRFYAPVLAPPRAARHSGAYFAFEPLAVTAPFSSILADHIAIPA